MSDERRQVYAYPDYVCLAILEYYAFEAGANVKPEAVQNFRQLAGMALREFIYTQLGYSPSARVPDSWSLFHDRVSLVFHTVPHGYFSVFKEMSDIIVTLIRQAQTWMTSSSPISALASIGQTIGGILGWKSFMALAFSTSTIIQAIFRKPCLIRSRRIAILIAVSGSSAVGCGTLTCRIGCLRISPAKQSKVRCRLHS